MHTDNARPNYQDGQSFERDPFGDDWAEPVSRGVDESKALSKFRPGLGVENRPPLLECLVFDRDEGKGLNLPLFSGVKGFGGERGEREIATGLRS